MRGALRTFVARNGFHGIWLAIYRHLNANPDHARFLLQVDHSPYRSAARQAAIAGGLAGHQPVGLRHSEGCYPARAAILGKTAREALPALNARSATPSAGT